MAKRPPVHGTPRPPPERMDAHAHNRAYGRRWKKFRRIALARLPPTCAMCGRLIDGSPDVHHVQPKARGGRDVIDNMAALCHGCHSRVTKRG